MAIFSFPAVVLFLQALSLAAAQATVTSSADTCEHTMSDSIYVYYGDDENAWSSCIAPYDQGYQTCMDSVSSKYPSTRDSAKSAATSGCACDQLRGSVSCMVSACPSATEGNTILENKSYNAQLYCKTTALVGGAAATATTGTGAAPSAAPTGSAKSTNAGSRIGGNTGGLADAFVLYAAGVLGLGIGAGAVLF